MAVNCELVVSHKLRRNNILSGIRSALAGGQPVLDVSILENALDFRAVIDNLEQIISIKNDVPRAITEREYEYYE